jgi:Tannase-like family of unknown function (DUF6351)
MRRWRAAAIAALAVTGLVPAAAGAHGRQAVHIDVLSSRPDQVSGGDALVRVQAPPGLLHRLRVERNGEDVTSALQARHGGLTGVIGGLAVGANELTAVWGHHRFADLRVTNFPLTGPMFSGPHQAPFVCKTNRPQPPLGDSLGEPLVDNQAGDGFRVLSPDGTTAGWSRDCSARTVVDFLYRTTGGAWKALPGGPGRPADMATTTTLDGRTVDFVVRRERGTIDRFLYSYAMLAPRGASDTDTSLWNRRLVYAFDGGVAIGHSQGTLGSSSVDPDLLGQGYAIAHSSGTDTSTHYNLQLGGEVALMTKERFVERYGVPLYTVGVGGSGGAIQQYVYGQNHPGLLDAGIAVKSYPDMTTQTIHVGDCELLEYYMDVTDAANPKWRNWDNREWLEGMNGNPAFPNPYTRQAGSDECVNGWRGLTPLALNPLFGTAGAGSERMDPAAMAAIRWTHWDDARNVYGVGPDGWARNPWDNIGVQYGLQALRDSHITPAEFLDLNARVGTWKEAKDMMQEGQPFLPVGGFDPWSSRNMRLSPDGGVTPTPRRSGDVVAMRNAYEKGLYFDGDVDMPILDIRPYLEEKLDMHNSHQSFAIRQRMLDKDGDASNQVIWFWGQDGGDRLMLSQAFQVMDQWLANLRAHPRHGVAANKPPGAVDSCFTSTGQTIAASPDVWAGILDHRPPGACTSAYPLHSTSRIVAGGPLRGGVYKCALQSVGRAIARGLYGDWRPSAAERARLEQIFPTGVCDYTRPDVGRPPGF